MRQLRSSAAIRSYLLDLVYLNATLTAANHIDLATRVQHTITDLRAERDQLERAEELEVVAQAMVTVNDVGLDEGLVQAGAFVRAHLPDEYAALFPKAPSQMAQDGYTSEISSVRTMVAKLDQLPADDVIRLEFAPRLTSACNALEAALKDKEEVARSVALVRLQLEKRRAAVNLLRLEVFGELLKRTKDKTTADRFFRTTEQKQAVEDPPA